MKKIEVMYCNPPFESPGKNCRVTFSAPSERTKAKQNLSLLPPSTLVQFSPSSGSKKSFFPRVMSEILP
ncbi:hypothetical protein MTO96_043895 [Rhipicephalus appendiculatus]